MMRINIDTDQIIPTLFLGGTDAKGTASTFSIIALPARRAAESDFILNQSPYDRAEVLLATATSGAAPRASARPRRCASSASAR
jgi:3-isopropylmalate/(R)-2-methylmalate dehydratase small subunit